MAHFKRLAKIQMLAALLFLPFIWPWLPFCIWLYGMFFADVLTWLDLLLFVVLPFAAVIVVASTVSGPVERARSLATDPSLVAERDRVVDVWLNGKLPDW